MRSPLPPLIVWVAFVAIGGTGCMHEVDAFGTDAMLFRDATEGEFIYYTGTPDITPPAPESPHGDFRVRFNSIAHQALDTATHKLPEGGSFPVGSVVVKDVYDGADVRLYAVMKKDPSSPLAGSGWLWAELGTDGASIFSSSRKGDGCIPCHSEGLQRDLVRVFDLH